MFEIMIFDGTTNILGVDHTALMLGDRAVMNIATKNIARKRVIMKVKTRIIIRGCHRPHYCLGLEKNMNNAGNIENPLL